MDVTGKTHSEFEFFALCKFASRTVIVTISFLATRKITTPSTHVHVLELVMFEDSLICTFMKKEYVATGMYNYNTFTQSKK